MDTLANHWQHLEHRIGSAYRQLFVKGTRIRAGVLYGLSIHEEEPMSPEQIAAEFNLPVEAVQEAIAYGEANPPEIQRDFEMEEKLSEASGMNDPDYKYHPRPKPIPPQDLARILSS